MSTNNSNDIEFEVEGIKESSETTVYVPLENDSGLKKIVRKFFRLPTGDLDEVTVQINDQQYDVIDILSQGLGIHLTDPEVFSVGEELHSIELTVQEKTLSLQGRVVHISPYDQGNYRCGIEFINQNKKDENTIGKYIQEYRSKLFSKK